MARRMQRGAVGSRVAVAITESGGVAPELPAGAFEAVHERDDTSFSSANGAAPGDASALEPSLLSLYGRNCRANPPKF
jgi:hypothetical protein